MNGIAAARGGENPMLVTCGDQVVEGLECAGVDVHDQKVGVLGSNGGSGLKHALDVAAEAEVTRAMEKISQPPTESGVLIHNQNPEPRPDIAFAAFHNKLARQEPAHDGEAASDYILAIPSPA